MCDPKFVPVIVGVGEVLDRPTDLSQALEPVALMSLALRNAESDCGGRLLDQLDSLDLVGLVSWRYVDPVILLAQDLLEAGTCIFAIEGEELRRLGKSSQVPFRDPNLCEDSATIIARREAEQQEFRLLHG